MTRRISLTIGVAAVALAIGVPTALGKGQAPQSAVEYFKANELATLVQSDKPSAVEYFKANELATLVESGKPSAVEYFRANELATLVQSESALGGYRDAHERTVGTGNQAAVAAYRDSFERRHVARTGLESNVATYRDAFERSNPQTASVTSSPVGSGTEIEWPQVGIGLALGVALMLGLLLAMRITRIRPLAH
jgi:hypothetical protein